MRSFVFFMAFCLVVSNKFGQKVRNARYGLHTRRVDEKVDYRLVIYLVKGLL